METIAHEGVVLAYIARASMLPSRTTFLTPEECNMQVGYVVYPAGGEIPRHAHLPVERHLVGSTEVLVIQQGRCEVDVYSEDRRLVATRELYIEIERRFQALSQISDAREVRTILVAHRQIAQ